MMKKLFAAVVMVMTCLAGWADSPLTSTHFASAYADEPMVQIASNFSTYIPTMMLNYLVDEKSPIDVRLAALNQTSWNFDGQSTADQMLLRLSQRHHCQDKETVLNSIDAKTLAVYAYAKAMSDYFDVNEASVLAHRAVEKDKSHSFSVAMVAALIDAQIYLDNDWSKIYPVVASVLNDESLHMDMRQEAIDAIMEYINEYQGY